jgi:pSer/pThr/pTyr-binding forkhead associated (FHA) protein
MYSVTMSFGGKPVHRFGFDKDFVTIGRDAGCDIVIENVGASRRHAQIARTASAYVLSDLESHNGTYVDGARITRRVLADGGEFQIGKYAFRFESADPVAVAPRSLDAPDVPLPVAPAAAARTAEPATGPVEEAAWAPASGAAALLAAAPSPVPARAEAASAVCESTMHLDRREIEKILGKFSRTKSAQLVQVAPESEKRTVALERSYYVVGADPSSDVRTPGWFAAPKAGFLVRTDNGWRAVAVARSFRVGGRFSHDVPLRDGDLLQVGRRRFRFSQGA